MKRRTISMDIDTVRMAVCACEERLELLRQKISEIESLKSKINEDIRMLKNASVHLKEMQS